MSYFFVNKDDSKGTTMVSADATKVVLAAAHKPRITRLLRAGKKGVGGTHFETTLFVKVTNSSGAGAALAIATPVAPSVTTEWSTFQGLFDDYKVVGARSQFFYASSVASVAGATPSYAVAYDATYASAPTSVVSLMESDDHLIGILDAAGNYPLTSHPSGSKNGFRTFSAHIPKSAIISPIAVTGGTGIVANLPGSWVDMGDATTCAAGYFKHYFEATTTSVVTLTQFIEIDVIFRQRT
jgi:hypothetical protein